MDFNGRLKHKVDVIVAVLITIYAEAKEDLKDWGELQ